MKLVTQEEYNAFLKSHKSVRIANRIIQLVEWQTINLKPTSSVTMESTLWSFPERGFWASHRGDFPGNWSPYVVRSLLEKYSRPGEFVCDPMVGSGTAMVECKLLERRGLGIDINPNATMVCMNRLDFEIPHESSQTTIQVYNGDARNLDVIPNGVVDLLMVHPPYSTIIRYSEPPIPGDISSMEMYEYLIGIEQIAMECYRVLKPGKICAVLVGDTRIRRHYVPISVAVLRRFLIRGFILKEDIIKVQHNVTSERSKWKGPHDFYKIAHEHIFVFRKLELGEDASRYMYSGREWF